MQKCKTVAHFWGAGIRMHSLMPTQISLLQTLSLSLQIHRSSASSGWREDCAGEKMHSRSQDNLLQHSHSLQWWSLVPNLALGKSTSGKKTNYLSFSEKRTPAIQLPQALTHCQTDNLIVINQELNRWGLQINTSWESFHLKKMEIQWVMTEKVTQHLPLRDYFEQILYWADRF